MTWQILIATVVDRANQFDELMEELHTQILDNNLMDKVEVLYDRDNREKTIGRKRQDLLESADAAYINFVDDDDMPYHYYVSEIYKAIQKSCDCVGFPIDMTTNGSNPQVCCHSLRYKKWDIKRDGYDYVRNVTIFNPVKRELALQAGFDPSLRFGEDKDYADRLTLFCKTEVFINKPLFHYRYSNLMPHNIKYGFK